MAKETIGFMAAAFRFFGKKLGQTASEFGAEVNELTAKDRDDIRPELEQSLGVDIRSNPEMGRAFPPYFFAYALLDISYSPYSPKPIRLSLVLCLTPMRQVPDHSAMLGRASRAAP